jgi:hypothetical protein
MVKFKNKIKNKIFFYINHLDPMSVLLNLNKNSTLILLISRIFLFYNKNNVKINNVTNVFAHIFLHAIISRTRVIIACQIVSEQIFEILYLHAIIRPKNRFLAQISLTTHLFFFFCFRL